MALWINLDWSSLVALISEVCEGITDICECCTLVYFRIILLFVRRLFCYEMIGYSQIGEPIIPGVGVDNLAVRLPPHSLIVLDIGHEGGYSYFKQMFEFTIV